MTRSRSPFAAILALEEAIAPLLRDNRRERLDPRWLDVARKWSAEVWTAARALGPAHLSPSAIEHGLELAQRPLFLCGTHRSGTTLLRDLLDDHPALSVLPSEGNFYTHFEGRLQVLSGERQETEMGQEWLRRLVNPANQPPFWLLGRSSNGKSAYVDFAREFMAWWVLLLDRAGARGGQWPLTAAAIAYARIRGGRPLMWAEKTPGNECFLHRLWGEFPKAKVIQVVRRPEAVLASHKALVEDSWGFNRYTARIYRNLARSFAIARGQSDDRFLLVHYEELVDAPAAAIRRIGGFLGIEWSASLLEQTVSGRPASSNTSFSAIRKGNVEVTALERGALSIALGDNAGALGYAGLEPRTMARRLARTVFSALPRGANGR